MYPHHRGTTAAMILVASTVVVSDACYAREAEQEFDLPAGPATSTINGFAKQAGMNVLAAEDVLAGISTNRLQGRYPAAEALRRLLAGTGLYGKVTASGAVFILPE
jgi:iron complex outermembrane receptor protein